MSSKYVRDEIKGFLTTTFPTEKVVEVDGEFEDLRGFLAKNNINNEPWIGLQYIGNEEVPVCLSATNDKGTFREVGAAYVHIVEVARLGVGAAILTRAESIINAFRSQHIGDIIIDRITPPNFGRGGTLDFEGGYTSASIILAYTRDLNL